MSALARAGDVSWEAQAACASVDPDLMFPEAGDYDRPEWADARSVCGPCPVKAECLKAAMGRGEAHGVFGGLDPDERRSLRRSVSRKARHARRRELAAA